MFEDKIIKKGRGIIMEKGYIGAQVNLGTMYAYGVGVEQDYAKAAEWFKKAAEQGNAGAQFNLGRMYEVGDGVEQDSVKAADCYKKAAMQKQDGV